MSVRFIPSSHPAEASRAGWDESHLLLNPNHAQKRVFAVSVVLEIKTKARHHVRGHGVHKENQNHTKSGRFSRPDRIQSDPAQNPT